jgi:ADP-ribose pyrophosphatase
MLKRWKTRSSEVVTKNPWWTYKVDRYEIPTGYLGEYHYVHTNGASMVVPVTADGKIILVNQYRYLCDRESIELPCGGVKDGATYDSTAAMELEEETGYRSDKLQRIGEFNPYNGVTDEMCAVYIAGNLIKSVAHPDATEEFETLVCSVRELDEMVGAGKIWDGMTLAAWALARNRLAKWL